MKICSVTFSNINSLAGTFTIDLENPDLTAAGLFLITGPTGAGKSTLLDAIAYALYARTPRQEEMGTKENEIMSRDFATCRASVVFEQGGTRYTVTSEHRRKRGRTEGAAPFAPPERHMERLLPNGQWVEICKGSQAVKNAVATITGIADINAFRRCMMLAQGEFSKFLTMSEAERATLLSTITRTEEYAAIGEQLFEKAREAERAVNELRERPTLSEEQRRELDAAVDAAQRKLTALQTERENGRAGLLWLRDKQEQERHYADAQARRSAAEEAVQAFEASGRLNTLHRAQRAAALAPAEERRNRATQQRGAMAEQLARTEGALDRLTPLLESAKAAHHAARKEEEERLPSLEKEQERITKEIRPAEQDLQAAQIRLTELRKREKGAADKQAQTARDAANAEQELVAWKTRCLAMEEEYKRLAPFAALPEAIAAISARQMAWCEHCASATAALPDTGETETRLNNLIEERSILLRERAPAELRSEAGALQQLQTANNEAEETARQWEAAKHSVAEAQSCLDALATPLARAEENVQKLSEVEENTRKLADLKDQLDECYRKFCAGEYEVCPCCGASTPSKHRSIGDSHLTAAHRLTLEAKNVRDSLLRQRDTEAQRLTRARTAEATLERTLKLRREEAARRLQELGLHTMPKDISLRIGELQAAAKRGEELTKDIEATRSLLGEAQLRDALHRELRPFCSALPTTAEEAKNQVQEMARTAKRIIALTRDLHSATARTEEKETTLTAARAQADAAAADRNKLTAETSAQQQTCDEQQKALQHLCGGKSADVLEKACREEEKSLRERSKLALLVLTEKQSEHAKLCSAREEQQVLLTQMQYEEAEALRLFIESLTMHAFADENEYAAAKRSETERAALEAEKKHLDEALTRAASESQALYHALQRHLEKPHSEQGEEELKARLTLLLTELSATEQELTDRRAEQKLDDEHHDENRRICDRRAELHDAHARWQLLKDVLGGTKDSFQKYAQSITFDALISEANRHLQKLFPRFVLTQNHRKGELQLGVTDLWLDDTTPRQVSNLSGGETFVVSLALALGLSGLYTSCVSIDTLFLDEGFGTLDPDTLHTVIAALEKLHLDGKLIGIITHVDELKESFPPDSNIQVEKLGNSGYSTLLEGPGITAAPAAADERSTTPQRRRKKKAETEASAKKA